VFGAVDLNLHRSCCADTSLALVATVARTVKIEVWRSLERRVKREREF